MNFKIKIIKFKNLLIIWIKFYNNHNKIKKIFLLMDYYKIKVCKLIKIYKIIWLAFKKILFNKIKIKLF